MPIAYRWRRTAVIAVVFIALIVLPVFRLGGVRIGDTEMGFVLGPGRLVSQLSHLWSPNLFGFNQARSQSLIFPVAVVFWLFEVFHLDPGYRTQAWLGLLCGGGALSFWWFLTGLIRVRDVKNDLVLGLSSVGFGISPFVVLLSSDTTMFLLAYVALPFLLGTVARFAKGLLGSFAAVSLIALGLLLCSAVDLPLLAIDCFATVLFGVIVLVGSPRYLKRVLVICLGVGAGLVGLAWVIGPTLESYLLLPQVGNAALGAESFRMYDAYTSWFNVVSLRGYWALYSGYAFRFYRPYADYMLGSFYGRASGLALSVLGLYGLLRVWRNKTVVLLSVCALVGARIVVGVFPGAFPAGVSSSIQWAARNVVLINVFRDTYKFMIVVIVAVFSGIALAGVSRSSSSGRSTRQVVVIFLASLAIVANAWPILSGSLWWPDKGTQFMPSYWLSAARVVDRLPDINNSRLLLLPYMSSPVFTWGTPPTNPAVALFDGGLLYGMPGQAGAPNQVAQVRVEKVLLGSRGGMFDAANEMLASLGIRYIVVEGDLRTGYFPGVASPEAVVRALSRDGSVKLVRQLGALRIYEVRGVHTVLVRCSILASRRGCRSVGFPVSISSTRLSGVLGSVDSVRRLSVGVSFDGGWTASGLEHGKWVVLKRLSGSELSNQWRVPKSVKAVTVRYGPLNSWLFFVGLSSLLWVSFLGVWLFRGGSSVYRRRPLAMSGHHHG